MPVISQNTFLRPILFVLHDTSSMGGIPLPYLFYIRPEELSITDPSRNNVHQSLGGGWVDGFGQGLETINIAGNTGWGQGNMPPGELNYHLLYNVVYKQWHAKREAAVKAGKDPDLVKLIFIDLLDMYWGVCAPMTFVLKRSRSRPLLFLYNINLIVVANTIASFAPQVAAGINTITEGITSAITQLGDFAGSLL